jgi:hypothetical protein
VNYLVQIGLAVLLLRFERECKEQQSEEKQIDFIDQLIRNEAISRLLRQANERNFSDFLPAKSGAVA